jgi:hypothetical protein
VTETRSVARPAKQARARATAKEGNEIDRQHRLCAVVGKASVSRSAIDSALERALSAEMAASELLRMRVVATPLAILLVADQLLVLFARDLVERFYQKPIPAWVPTRIIGPFLVTKLWRCSFALRSCAWKHRPNHGEVRQCAD